MYKHYLVIWQLSTNEQSREETPVDIYVRDNQVSAELIFDSILLALKKVVGEFDNIKIVGIFLLF